MKHPAHDSAYRPLYRMISIGGSESYPIVDMEVAGIRADYHLKQARQLQKAYRVDPSESMRFAIEQEFLAATDYGSKEAPFALAQFALEGQLAEDLSSHDIITFYELAAERGHGEAAYRLACCYGAMKTFPRLEALLQSKLQSLATADRVRLAIYHFETAIQTEHNEAIQTLILSYAYGRGLIPKNAERFIRLCTGLIQKQKYGVALGYGAWLAGMTVKGEKPLAGAIRIKLNYEQALQNLLLACRSPNRDIACQAIHLIGILLERGVWQSKSERRKFKEKLNDEAMHGNQFIAFYLLWYSLPAEKRPVLPAILRQAPFAQIATLIRPNEANALHYLDGALQGKNQEVAETAQMIIQNSLRVEDMASH